MWRTFIVTTLSLDLDRNVRKKNLKEESEEESEMVGSENFFSYQTL